MSRAAHIRLLTALVIVLVVLVFYLSPLPDLLTFERLKSYRDSIQDVAHRHPLRSVLIYIGIYVVFAGLSLPGGPVVTMGGGVAFGAVAGALYTDIGATVGAAIAFLMARFLVGKHLQQRYREKLTAFNREIENGGVYYMLTLRFMPVVPFTWINLASGLSPMKMGRFLWTTAVGILPGTLVNSYTGSCLGRVNSPRELLSPGVLAAFFLLGIVALLPVLYRRMTARRKQ